MKRNTLSRVWRSSARLIGMALLFTTIASAMPLKARADGGTYNIGAGNITITVNDSGTQTVQVGNNAAVQDANPVITGQSTTNTISIEVANNQVANATLSGVTVNVSSVVGGEAALKVQGDGAVNIELNNDNSLQSPSGKAGLQDDLGGVLTIADTDNDGSLTATGGSLGPGIGGSHITITGGTITANGGNGAAGIGGGSNGEGSNITISGGTVSATGGNY